MKIVHFCAGLSQNNGMANAARMFVDEELSEGKESSLTDNPNDIAGADIVNIHGSWLPILWMVAEKAKKNKSLLIVHPSGNYDPLRRRYHWWKKWIVSPFEHKMLEKADAVHATCKAEVEWIKAYHPTAKTVLIDLKHFFSFPENAPVVPRQIRRVLYLGRIHPLKGIKYLKRALRGSDIELRIESSVFGYEREEAFDWCDVLVLPTLSENFGLVVAEALERGKFVITTDGAPVWENHPGVRYIRGFRDASASERVTLLKKALGLGI